MTEEHLFSNQYIQINYNKVLQFLHTKWITAPYMPVEDYKAVLLIYLKYVQHTKPTNVLIDAVDSQFIIPPALQDWINDEIYTPAIRSGVKKLAFLISNDLYTQISLELLVDDTQKKLETKPEFEQKFFADIETAYKWLLGSTSVN